MAGSGTGGVGDLEMSRLMISGLIVAISFGETHPAAFKRRAVARRCLPKCLTGFSDHTAMVTEAASFCFPVAFSQPFFFFFNSHKHK